MVRFKPRFNQMFKPEFKPKLKMKAITKRYLGLRQEEILETYDVLSF